MIAQPLLLAIVGSELGSSAALRRAVALARRSGARLHVSAFVFDGLVDLHNAPQRPPEIEAACHKVVDDYKRQLRALVAELAQPQLHIDYDVCWAPIPHEAILAKAIQLGASCVIKDVARESALRRLLFTPLDWKLIRLLPCELMLVAPQSPPDPARVLAAVDVLAEEPALRGGLNDRIIEAAAALAEHYQARLDLVSAAPWFLVPNNGTQAARHHDALLAQHLEAFLGYAERHRVPQACRHRIFGTPHEVIAKLADDLSADITVVGNIYRSGWDRLLLGSTAEALLQQLRSDLLVVKPRDFLATLRQQVDVDALCRRFTHEQPKDARPEWA